MRSYLRKKRRLNTSDLTRILSDVKRNADKARTRKTRNKNRAEARAVDYVLTILYTGKAPHAGRPSTRVQEILAKTSVAKKTPRRGEFI